MENLSLECELISKDISLFITNWLSTRENFECRTFYGEAFTLNLLYRHNLLSDEIKLKLLSGFESKDKTDPEYHFEFNNYAFQDYYNQSNDLNVREYFLPLKFKGTKCTNWTLLRSVVSLKEDNYLSESKEAITNKLLQYQLPSGLILDDKGVKSFQYHCFSAAMVFEYYEIFKTENIKKSFLNAVSFIRTFILPNGDTLYIGRGQEQSFGIGTLIYILSAAYKLTGELDLLGDIKKLLKFLRNFQRPDGSFPLVFNGVENSIPRIIDMENPDFCGWYPYNNYFDYLPFMGFFLHKASILLGDIESVEFMNSPQLSYSDSSFIKIVKSRYIAILSLPGGYWSNDLPVPLIFYKNENITPVLGGEQFQKSLYTIEALSFPVTQKGRHSWRKFGKGFWFKNNLIWFSFFGIYLRKFSFLEDRINIESHFYSYIKSFDLYSFKDEMKFINNELISKNVKISFSKKGEEIQKGYSVSGKLKVLKFDGSVRISMELL